MSNKAVLQDALPLDALHFPLYGKRLIEASAGTGKTYTIANLYLRMLLPDRGPAADHHSDTAPTFGHCHPGLDCFTAAAFLLDPSLPTPAEASEETVWFSKLETDRWIPSSDKPPPRHFS